MRGSVDAGQPDQHHLNTILSLVTKEKTVEEEIIPNHINVNVLTKKNDTQIIDKDSRKLSTKSQSKPSINVTTNPLDISLCNSQSPSIAQSSTGTRGRGRPPGNFFLKISIYIFYSSFLQPFIYFFIVTILYKLSF